MITSSFSKKFFLNVLWLILTDLKNVGKLQKTTPKFSVLRNKFIS